MRRKSSLLPCSIQSSCLPQVQHRNLSGLTQDLFLLMQSYWWSLQPSRTAVLHIQGLAFQAAVKLCLLHCAQCRDGSEWAVLCWTAPFAHPETLLQLFSHKSLICVILPSDSHSIWTLGWTTEAEAKWVLWVLFLHSHSVGSCWPGCISLLRTRPFLSVSVSLHSDICPLLFPNPGNATLLLLDQTVPQFLAVFLKPSPPPLKTFM